MANFTFQKGKTYKFGNLRPGSRADEPDPLFQRPGAIALDGSTLREAGMKDFAEFLGKVVDTWKFPANKIIYAYEMQDGQHKYLAEGNPVPASSSKQVAALADNTGLDFRGNPYALQHMPANMMTGANKDVVRMYSDQINDLRKQLLEAQSVIAKKDDKIAELLQQKSDKEVELQKVTIERDTYKGFAEKYTEESKEGLSDGAVTKLIDMGTALLNNPVVGNALGNIIGSFAGRFIPMPPQAEQQQPPPPKTDELFGGSDTRNVGGAL